MKEIRRNEWSPSHRSTFRRRRRGIWRRERNTLLWNRGGTCCNSDLFGYLAWHSRKSPEDSVPVVFSNILCDVLHKECSALTSEFGSKASSRFDVIAGRMHLICALNLVLRWEEFNMINRLTYSGGHHSKGTNGPVPLFWVFEWWGFHDSRWSVVDEECFQYGLTLEDTTACLWTS